ncbi:MAG: FAD:protein FMN transferase [Deltaproteobacteria bacterium]|nr:FAD:protein FMN transferase [Deltaproteobacteria bacterium]
MLPFNRPTLIVVLALVAVIFGLRQWGSAPPEEIRKSRILMDTVVEITVFGSPSLPLQESVDAAFKEMERIEALTSFFEEKSDLSRLRGDAGFEVSPETAAIITTGLEIAAASGGAFDMTLGRLKNIWQIEGDQPRLPQPEEIQEALSGSGFGALVLEGRRLVRRAPETRIDLGGIAKGYAIDCAIAVLKKAGIEHAAVNAGGDIRMLGDRRGQPWRIAIQHPRQPNRYLGRLLVRDVAVVTSGDYERFFEKDGIRYHHLFDPRTGYPATASQSVTVLADKAVLADALATAVFVLGPKEGIALLDKFPGTEGMIVGADGTPVYTPGFGKLIEWHGN